jgi:hypothetical protein
MFIFISEKVVLLLDLLEKFLVANIVVRIAP